MLPEHKQLHDKIALAYPGREAVSSRELLDIGIEVRNHFARATLARAGMVCIGENKNGNSYYALPGVNVAARWPTRAEFLDYARAFPSRPIKKVV